MKKLILYAEDDEKSAALYIHLFQQAGYDVMWAEDGQEALKKYQEEAPDIVVLDIKMPLLDGHQVAKEIRKKDLETPILMLTSIDDKNEAIKCLNLKIDDFVRKDGDKQELLAIIKRRIERYPVVKERMLILTPDTRLDMNNNILHSSDKAEKINFRVKNLLIILWRHKNKPLQREYLEKEIWNDFDATKEEHLNRSITLLRKIMANDQRVKINIKRGDSITFVVESD